MSDAFGSSEIWVCAAEMPDGALLVATRTAGVQRVTAAARRIVAAVGDWQLVELTPEFAEVDGASTARVVALHSAGWAVALGEVAAPVGGGGGGSDEVSYWPTGATRGVELWAYAGGVWTVAARGVTEAQGEAFEIVTSGDEVYAMQLGVALHGQLAWVRRGRALAVLQRADWPVIVAERTLFSNNAGRLAGAWYGVSNTYNNVDGTGATGAPKICQAHGRYLLPRASAEGQGLGAAGNAGALHLGLGVSDGGMLPQWTWQWGVFGTDGGLQVAEIAASLDSITSGAPGMLAAVSTARWGGQQSMTLEQGNGLYRIERMVTRTGTEPGLAEIRLGAAGGAGTARPRLTAISLSCSGPRANRPSLTEARLGCSNGAGMERPALEEMRLGCGGGTGTNRPTLCAIMLGCQRKMSRPDLAEIRIGATGHVTPATGTVMRYIRMEGETAATEAKLVVDNAEGMQAMVRVDSAAEKNDWGSYRAMAIGEDVQLPLPGYVVEVALAKRAEAATPGVRLDVPRPPAD